MTHADRILGALSRYPQGLDDDELSTLLGITPRQAVNQVCRRLAAAGVIRRAYDPDRGKLTNYCTECTQPDSQRTGRSPRGRPAAAVPISHLAEQHVTAYFMRREGLALRRVTTGEKGFDLKSDTPEVFVEVKAMTRDRPPHRFLTQGEMELARECARKGKRWELHLVVFDGNRVRHHYALPAEYVVMHAEPAGHFRLPLRRPMLEAHRVAI